MTIRRLITLTLALTVAPLAHAGAWEQPEGQALLIYNLGYAVDEDDRYVFEGYSEFGLGDGFTAVVTMDNELLPSISRSVWRVTGGLRYTTTWEFLPEFVFAIEPRLTYQAHEKPIISPVFAGDGIGYGLRIDVGYPFEIWDMRAYANVGLSAANRSQAQGEYKAEAVVGLELDADWRAGIAYFGSYAPGEIYQSGVYEKHEGQAFVRRRLDDEFELGASVSYAFAVDRTPRELTLRLSLWWRAPLFGEPE